MMMVMIIDIIYTSFEEARTGGEHKRTVPGRNIFIEGFRRTAVALPICGHKEPPHIIHLARVPHRNVTIFLDSARRIAAPLAHCHLEGLSREHRREPPRRPLLLRRQAAAPQGAVLRRAIFFPAQRYPLEVRHFRPPPPLRHAAAPTLRLML